MWCAHWWGVYISCHLLQELLFTVFVGLLLKSIINALVRKACAVRLSCLMSFVVFLSALSSIQWNEDSVPSFDKMKCAVTVLPSAESVSTDLLLELWLYQNVHQWAKISVCRCLGEFFIILKWYVEGLAFDILWALQEMMSFMFKFPYFFFFKHFDHKNFFFLIITGLDYPFRKELVVLWKVFNTWWRIKIDFGAVETFVMFSKWLFCLVSVFLIAPQGFAPIWKKV